MAEYVDADTRGLVLDVLADTGHADFVETQHGEWWAVFLATRPYQDYLYNIGRETFMLPVR